MPRPPDYGPAVAALGSAMAGSKLIVDNNAAELHAMAATTWTTTWRATVSSFAALCWTCSRTKFFSPTAVLSMLQDKQPAGVDACMAVNGRR